VAARVSVTVHVVSCVGVSSVQVAARVSVSVHVAGIDGTYLGRMIVCKKPTIRKNADDMASRKPDELARYEGVCREASPADAFVNSLTLMLAGSASIVD
jgi:hypothetical protein